MLFMCLCKQSIRLKGVLDINARKTYHINLTEAIPLCDIIIIYTFYIIRNNNIYWRILCKRVYVITGLIFYLLT